MTESSTKLLGNILINGTDTDTLPKRQKAKLYSYLINTSSELSKIMEKSFKTGSMSTLGYHKDLKPRLLPSTQFRMLY